MTKFNAYHKMKELLTNYYIEAKTTSEKPIAWITSGAPVEFLYAMDILPAYPENHAVVLQAKHKALETAEAAEADGYSTDICSYTRCDLGCRFILKTTPPCVPPTISPSK